MLEVQTNGAAAERFQIIFSFDDAKTALTGAVFLFKGKFDFLYFVIFGLFSRFRRCFISVLLRKRKNPELMREKKLHS